MTTSGTTAFTMDVAQIVEEAAHRIGGWPLSADEASSARISLNLLLLHLLNKSAPLNSQVQQQFTTSTGVTSYTLDTAITNTKSVAVLDDQLIQETELNREDFQAYNTSYLKTQTGRPTTYFLTRTDSGFTMILWPKPDKEYTIRFIGTKRLEDVSKASEGVDLPVTYLPAICSGLSYYMSLKRQNFDPNVRSELKNLYIEEMTAALNDDRLRTDMKIVPKGR